MPNDQNEICVDDTLFSNWAPLDFQDGTTPFATTFDDIYFSKQDGLLETRHVFLTGNQLAERFSHLKNTNDIFTIAETGFGTGLNFLATWQLFDQLIVQQQLPARLHFISAEKYPIAPEDIEKAIATWPELAPYCGRLIKHYPPLPHRGHYHLSLTPQVTLTLIFDDVTSGFSELLRSEHPRYRHSFGEGVNAWFLDGFAPTKNPDMWSDALFELMSDLSAPQATLATFTAAGFVRRGLEAQGFTLQKTKGFGRKREQLIGVLPEKKTQKPLSSLSTVGHKNPYPSPWPVTPNHGINSRRAAVIGAGLAGCQTAHALAKRGWHVDIYEAKTIASGASGNSQGVIYGKLSPDADALAEFNRLALIYAQQFYTDYWDDLDSLQSIGVLQLADSMSDEWYRQLAEKFKTPNKFIEFLSAEAASILAEIPIAQPAIFFPKLGALSPPALCRQLINHKNITSFENTPIHRLRHEGNHWQLHNHQTIVVDRSYDAVVFANAKHALQLIDNAYLPVKSIRGQVSTNSDSLSQIPTNKVVCGKGYLIPVCNPAHSVHAGVHAVSSQTFGATFSKHSESTEVTTEEHQENIHHLSKTLPLLTQEIGGIDANRLSGRVGFRTTTPDYLPIVGAVPDYTSFKKTYEKLGKNARAMIHDAGCYSPGLYINIGYGSRGLAYTPLGAEYLASLMSNETLPLPRSLADALHAGRFLIRDIIRNKIK